MADDRELRAGLLSGIAAGAMVLALTAMALMSFDPAHAVQLSIADVNAAALATVTNVAHVR